MESGAEFEALVRIYWDRKEQKFIPFVPKQRVTKDRVTVRLTDEDLPDDTRYLYYADIHSTQQHEGGLFRHRRSG